MTAPRVRLYGHTSGESSFTQVTRGMAMALKAAGELAGVCPVGSDLNDEEIIGGADAPVSLNCGNPMGLMTAHRLGKHEASWLLLAPNGETLPEGIVALLTDPSEILPKGLMTGGLLAPSGWAASVLRRYFPEKRVVVCPHGVTPGVHTIDRVARMRAHATFNSGRFDVLHMTSTETERKGTQALLAAWKRLKQKGLLPPLARLQVFMNPVHMSRIRWWCSDYELSESDISVWPGLVNDQTAVAALYSSAHAVCQPSRGEGFGMVPAEALACGVPVVATACTGHSEYLGVAPPGAVIVEHGDVGVMDDFQGSRAPTVSAEAIGQALTRAFMYWEALARDAEQNADAFAAEWAWTAKSLPGIQKMLKDS